MEANLNHRVKSEKVVFTVYTFYQTVSLSLSDLIDNRWGLLFGDIVRFSRKIEKKGRGIDLLSYVKEIKGNKTTLVELEDMIQRYYFRYLCRNQFFVVNSKISQ